MNMMTLAAFKRLAKQYIAAGTPLTLELVSRYGATLGTDAWDKKVPKELKGPRHILAVNTVGVQLEVVGSNQTYECRLEHSSLCKIQDGYLYVFAPGTRDLTPAEKAFDAKWKAIEDTPEYQERMTVDCLGDGNSCYYQMKAFYQNNKNPDMSYLTGSVEQHGCKAFYQDGAKRIRDKSIPGEEILRYRILELDPDSPNTKEKIG